MRFFYRPNHPKASENGFVSEEDVGDSQPPRALDAPIMVDRFYEGLRATDGTDIGSRRRHREYMREHGLTTADDYTQIWAKAEAAREDRRTNFRMPSKTRRDAIGRALYQKWKP